MDIAHVPVLLEEVVSYLAPADKSPCLMIDGTLGEGGHSERFLRQFPFVSICGLDADPAILLKAKKRLEEFGDRIRFYNCWHEDFFSSYPLAEPADRILLDLGISVFHYTESGRGFSFQKDEPLDMRLDVSRGESAAEYLSRCGEAELRELLFRYGEERYAARIARSLVELRRQEGAARIRALGAKDFAALIWKAVPADYRHGRIHPATRTFQALRILVNDEVERLPRVIEAAFGRLSTGGRLGIISFHSLEDRSVKRCFQTLSRACICPPSLPRCECGGEARARIVTKKPAEASEEEAGRNPPSRSAKLRVIEKLKEFPPGILGKEKV